MGVINKTTDEINTLLDKVESMPEEGVSGKTPVLETGTTTTLEAGSSATSEVVANGTDSSGNPKYKINFGIPRGYDGTSTGGGTSDSVDWSNITNMPTWVQSSTKPSYTAEEVGALPESTTIPSKTSELTNDSGYVASSTLKTINGQSIVGTGNIEISGTGEGISDAPSDGTKYVRQNGNWVEETAVDTSAFATKTELSSKQETLVSGTNIKTVNGNSLLGEGNIEISGTGSGIADAPSDDKTYGRKNGAWEEVSSGGGSVNITDIFMRLQGIETGGKCTQEDYDALKGYVDNGIVTYISVEGTSTFADISTMTGNLQVIFKLCIYDLESLANGIQYAVYTITSDLTVTVGVISILDVNHIYQLAITSKLTNYQKKSAYSKITNSDTILTAIEKLEAGLTPSVKTSTASSVKHTISPNVFYKYGVCSKIEITFTAGDTNSYNEYMLEFQSGDTPTELVLPDGVKWAGDHEIESNMTYQVSIVNNLAVMGGWANE